MRVIVGGALIALLSSVAVPALAASANGTGSVTILRPITVTNNANLAFGTIVKPASGSGTVTVTTGGVRSVGGSNPPTALASTTATAADFTVSGEGGQLISVSVPATFDLTGPSSATLTVTTSATHIGSQTLSNALGGAGTLDVAVGGTITVADTTTTGAYTGTFSVSADYQ